MQTTIPTDFDIPVRRAPGHFSVDVDGDIMLMSTAEGCYVGLDTIGSAIWRQLDTAQTPAELCHWLSHRYEADADVLRRDVASFLQSLQTKRLIETVSL